MVHIFKFIFAVWKILVEKYGDVKNRMEMIDNKKVKKIISQYGGGACSCFASKSDNLGASSPAFSQW